MPQKRAGKQFAREKQAEEYGQVRNKISTKNLELLVAKLALIRFTKDKKGNLVYFQIINTTVFPYPLKMRGPKMGK